MNRLDKMQHWLEEQVSVPIQSLDPISGDASFRRYFRLRTAEGSYVAMDAPPEKESCEHFVAIARSFLASGLKVPEIYAACLQQGFLLLSDFGDDLLLDHLSAKTVDHFYHI